MSRNCVEAAIEVANEFQIPIMLVASRRQIDSETFGGGYVHNWTTHVFVDFVRERDKGGFVVPCRDHGGPWQNPLEARQRMSLPKAMDSAKDSYEADILAGMEIIHIDPSIDIFNAPSQDEILNRVFELYEFCWETAQRYRKKIFFEVGTEEQSGAVKHSHDVTNFLQSMESFCSRYSLPKPLFIVAQIGTKVMETRNIGSMDCHLRIVDEIAPEIQIPKIVSLCRQYGVFLKVHNTDYLSDESLRWYPNLGIHAANVAPEFGVEETRGLLALLRDHALSPLADRFLRVAHESGRWKKWMLPASEASDEDKAVIAGHYVFSMPDALAVFHDARIALSAKGIDLDAALKERIKRSMLRYVRNFRLN